jgi:hypothetical protein
MNIYNKKIYYNYILYTFHLYIYIYTLYFNKIYYKSRLCTLNIFARICKNRARFRNILLLL